MVTLKGSPKRRVVRQCGCGSEELAAARHTDAPQVERRLVGERTALINHLHAILLERGIVASPSKRKLEQLLVNLMDQQGGAGSGPGMTIVVILRIDVRPDYSGDISRTKSR